MIKGYTLSEAEYDQVVKLINYTQEQLGSQDVKDSVDTAAKSKVDSAMSCLKTVQNILNK